MKNEKYQMKNIGNIGGKYRGVGPGYALVEGGIIMKRCFLGLFLTVSFVAFLSSCGGDGGSGAQSCDVVANAGWSSKLKVINDLDSGVEWIMEDYAFGADMKPGECTIFGVSPGDQSVDLTQCNIGDEGCNSTFGPTETVYFTVDEGETYTIKTSEVF